MLTTSLDTQRSQLGMLLKNARDTLVGERYGFVNINCYDDYRSHVPVSGFRFSEAGFRMTEAAGSFLIATAGALTVTSAVHTVLLGMNLTSLVRPHFLKRIGAITYTTMHARDTQRSQLGMLLKVPDDWAKRRVVPGHSIFFSPAIMRSTNGLRNSLHLSKRRCAATSLIYRAYRHGF